MQVVADCPDETRQDNVMTLFTAEEATRVAEEISAVEKLTSGEIVAVVAADSGSYLYAPFLWAAVVALLVPWPLIYLTWWPMQWVYFAQLAVCALLVMAFWPREMRMMLVPRSLKHMRAHRRAVEQFLVQNLTTTRNRTGVLIFVSMAERYAEIIPDTGISAKLSADTWQAIVDKLTSDIGSGNAADGFVAAIRAVGEPLAKHFPPGSDQPPELPNHLIVLD